MVTNSSATIVPLRLQSDENGLQIFGKTNVVRYLHRYAPFSCSSSSSSSIALDYENEDDDEGRFYKHVSARKRLVDIAVASLRFGEVNHEKNA